MTSSGLCRLRRPENLDQLSRSDRDCSRLRTLATQRSTRFIRDAAGAHHVPQGLMVFRRLPWGERQLIYLLAQRAGLWVVQIAAQDAQLRDLEQKIDKLSFSPWHATEDHKPLGNVMRARRVAYEASAALRGQRPEPTAIPI